MFSFDFEKFIASSKQCTYIKRRHAKAIAKALNQMADVYKRQGDCAISTAYFGTTVCITNEELATNLYNAISAETFEAELSHLLSEVSIFSDLKFFVDKKRKKVIYVYYKSDIDHSTDFLARVFENLQLVRNLLSTDDYRININYEVFFEHYFSEYEKTSFLTSFFTSIVSEDYEFTSERLYNIAGTLVHLNYKCVLPLQKGSFATIVPGMYKDSLDCFFDNSVLPKNIRINILKLIYNKDAFASYSDFFAPYDQPDCVSDCYTIFKLDRDFVFDDALLSSSLTLVEETDEFATFFAGTSNEHVIIKVKDTTRLNDYLSVLSDCVNSGFLHNMCIISNFDNSCYYLVFTYSHTDDVTLKKLVHSPRSDWFVNYLISIAKVHWNFAFKANTNPLDCIVGYGPFTLDPCCVSKLDFNRNGTPRYYRVIILQMVKEFVESHSIALDKIYSYDFMKVLPFTFAKHLIDYIKTGVYNADELESCGDVLVSDHACDVVFLDNLSLIRSMNHPDQISFLPEFASNAKVQTITARKSQHSVTDYINSPECFDYVRKAGLVLSDSVLNKLFSNTGHNFLAPKNVIISSDITENGNYKIIGIVWDQFNLQTIGHLISSGSLTTPVLYTMLASLFEMKDELTFEIHENNIKSLLVDQWYKVVLNPNALKEERRVEYTYCNLTNRKFFDTLVNVFMRIIDSKTWCSLDHFKFKELEDASEDSILQTVRGLKLCKEHNHYYLPGTLCPECRKIYSIEKFPSYNAKAYSDFRFKFYTTRKHVVGCSKPYNVEAGILAEVKLGIEKGLYDKFFFKPKKMAVNSQRSVWGVVFDAIDFENLILLGEFRGMQRLKAILVMYKKLLPYILDGTFIATDINMFRSIAMHKEYKGEILILDIPYMECSAVLSDDKTSKIEATKKAFAKFLTEYITEVTLFNRVYRLESSSIKALITNIRDLKFDENAVRECITTVCEVHNVPFSAKHSCCPLCEQDGISKDVILLESPAYFTSLQDSKAPYEGGEATLYPYGDNEVQKLFKSGVDLVLKSKILGKALQKAQSLREFNQSHPDIQFVTINKVRFVSNGKSVKLKGYTQNLIKDSFKISCLKDKEFVNAHGYTRNDIVSILIKVCIGIEFLHSIGTYIGDLNGGNILIKGNTVYFIDLDGMSFDDVKNFVYTDTYIYPPSAESKNITMADDWYSLAVQAFYYLTYSHPFRGICENSRVPSGEVARMKLGISVLGKHEIKVPKVSIGWDFMPEYLVSFFLDTFEGTKRESMKNVLESYLADIGGPQPDELKLTEVTRNYNCQYALSHNTYIDTSGNLVWLETPLLALSAKNIICRRTGDCFVFFTPTQTIVLNDKNGITTSYGAMPSTTKVWGTTSKLFYLSDDEETLYMKYLDKETGTETVKSITRATNNKLVDFLVTEDNKFIFLEKETETQFVIYCNLEKLTSIDVSSLHAGYSSGILYDRASGSYLVGLNSKGITLGAVISKDGRYKLFQFAEQISKTNCFFKNTLYYVSDGKICFYNLRDGTTNYFDCPHVTRDSLIERSANRFVICAREKSYVYVKS